MSLVSQRIQARSKQLFPIPIDDNNPYNHLKFFGEQIHGMMYYSTSGDKVPAVHSRK